jgi:parallel beta-helix repeat protein
MCVGSALRIKLRPRCCLALLIALGSGLLLPGSGVAGECGGLTPCKCGDRVASDYDMTADLGPCPGQGVYVASGVTLDCRDRIIRGSGGQVEQFGINLARGTTGATVRNCEVTGFLRGIRLQSAHHNRLIGNHVHHNGNVTSHIGYGIDVAGGSTVNLLQGNHVHDNADEGIHIGTGSHRNTLIGNHVYANFRENIYLLRSDGGVFQNNITYGGSNSLFLKHAAFNRFETNTFRDRVVAIRGDSHDNQFMNNDFIGAGLHFQAYKEGTTLTRPTRNGVVGGSLVGAKPCVRFSGGSGNLIKGVWLAKCAGGVPSAGAGASVENTFIGVALNPGALSLDRHSRVHVGWQLDASVQDANGSAVAGARVKGFDVYNNLIFDAVTAEDGKIPTQDVIQYSQDGPSRTSYTPHTLWVTAMQRTAMQKVAIDSNKTLKLSIPPAER